MRTRKKILRTALALAVGGVMLAPIHVWTMDAGDAPESVTIDSLANLYGPVEFDHVLHVDVTSCEQCHHHTTGGAVTDENCARCHTTSGESDVITCTECHQSDRFDEKYLKTLEDPKLYHIDKPGLKGAYHLNCIGCHQQTGGPTGCQDCHTMNESGEKLFDTHIKPSPANATSSTGH